jgi:hypothetical protein
VFVIQDKGDGREDKIGVFQYNSIVLENLDGLIDYYLFEIKKGLDMIESGNTEICQAYPNREKEFKINDKYLQDLQMNIGEGYE